jgi:hypothetical protein
VVTGVGAGEAGPDERVRALARSSVRAGLSSPEEMHAEVAGAITAELPDRASDADELASTWLEAAHHELRADQRDWPESTDYERLQSAFAEMELLDVSVLQGCEDHRAAERLVAEADAAGAGIRGVAWFTPADVRRAVDEGVLEITLRPGTAASDEELAGDLMGILEKHGLRSVSDEGRVQVDALWQRRIAT